MRVIVPIIEIYVLKNDLKEIYISLTRKLQIELVFKLLF